MTDDELAASVLAGLAPLGAELRRPFGSRRLFLDGRWFGFIEDGRLYLRTDDESRPEYVNRGMQAYQPTNRPRGPRTVDRNFEVPPDELADADVLAEWALRASQVGR